MKTASLKEIKKELELLHPSQLLNICVQLIKYKKENKELISYLLFDSDDEKGFINDIKKDIDDQFDEISKSYIYQAKKQLRKNLRLLNKYIKYSGLKTTEVDLRIYFCLKIRRLPSSLLRQNAILSIYERQINIIKKALNMLHEDLQFDYGEELAKLTQY